MENSKIQWTDATWNIARGCTKVDEDCKFCYMYRQSLNGTRYQPKEVVKTKTVFKFPLTFKKEKSDVWDGPPLIFTSSLTDVFHEDIDTFRHEAFDIIRDSKFIYQIPSKRPERMVQCLPPDWGNGWDNVWLGTSVGSQASINRAYLLAAVNARVRFLSLEPLHGPINLYPLLSLTSEMRSGKPGSAIDWVIVGGESGNEKGQYRYRPCKIEWIEKIIDDCKKAGVPVFVKQLGTHLSKQLGLSDRHGGNINEWPDHLKVREFPKPYSLKQYENLSLDNRKR